MYALRANRQRSQGVFSISISFSKLNEIVCKLWIVLVREKEQHLNLNLIPMFL